ncbi:HNH endonuclease signature motif containing protein [Spiroplasma culicicola]|uniref:HNH endonuclease signature motif containing protein n=1 Tax=Spiroplasma culicicola TaxID=216935 RepID=UPI00130E3160|nr:HNH endonuclease signature motif containing protein [Spiroplasma culicicola]
MWDTKTISNLIANITNSDLTTRHNKGNTHIFTEYLNTNRRNFSTLIHSMKFIIKADENKKQKSGQSRFKQHEPRLKSLNFIIKLGQDKFQITELGEEFLKYINYIETLTLGEIEFKILKNIYCFLILFSNLNKRDNNYFLSEYSKFKHFLLKVNRQEKLFEDLWSIYLKNGEELTEKEYIALIKIRIYPFLKDDLDKEFASDIDWNRIVAENQDSILFEFSDSYHISTFFAEILIMYFLDLLLKGLDFDDTLEKICEHLEINNSDIIFHLKEIVFNSSFTLNFYDVITENIVNYEINRDDIKRQLKKNVNSYLSKEKHRNNFKKINVRDRTLFNQNKYIVKEFYDFQCFFEENYSCRYFKQYNSVKNYVEIHHIIPHSKSDSFKNSIEVLGNYISLCPNCHKQIHNGTRNDVEMMLKKIYEFKQQELMEENLECTFEMLMSFFF